MYVIWDLLVKESMLLIVFSVIARWSLEHIPLRHSLHNISNKSMSFKATYLEQFSLGKGCQSIMDSIVSQNPQVLIEECPLDQELQEEEEPIPIPTFQLLTSEPNLEDYRCWLWKQSQSSDQGMKGIYLEAIFQESTALSFPNQLQRLPTKSLIGDSLMPSKTTIQSQRSSQIGMENRSEHRKSREIQKQRDKNKKPSKLCSSRNFLQTFKPFFINYLQQSLDPKIFSEDQFLMKMKEQSNMSYDKCQELFRIDKYRQYLDRYFKDKVHYRQLMATGVSVSLKKFYISKIHEFERAFRRGSFKKTNKLYEANKCS